MRGKLKLFFLPVLVSLMLFSFISVGFGPPKNAQADEALYSEKIVAVVYDNSGSMKQEQRSPNAKYALQALLSIFDTDDTMSIFPLNPSSSSTGITVDLSNENRDKVIEGIIANQRFTPGNHNSGTGTPPDAVGYATDWLASKGMNKLEPVVGKEFWLVILSDGDFTSTKNTSAIIREEISGYIGLQTIYFGISASEGMKINDLVQENSAVTAYYTNGTDDIISAMRELSNQVTGRYTLPTGVTVNGKQVTVDLSDCSFSISSVAVLAEATDTTENIKLETVEGSNVKLKNMRACSISIHEDPVHKSGYSSVIVPVDANEYLNKDVITLTFNTEIKDISVLVEPSIILDSELQYQNTQNEWEETTVDVINTSFKKGAKIKPVFRLLDGKTGKNLTDVLSNVEASVSYNGKSYSYGEGISLDNGKREVALSVTINIGGSKYVLYNSWLCDIDEKPESFRVDGKVTENYQGNKNKVKVDYTVYYDDVKLTDSKFAGNSPEFTCEVVELLDPQGNSVSYDKHVNADGTISIIYVIDPSLYGSYTNKVKVVCQENKRYRFGSSQFDLAIEQLAITTNANDMTLTTNQISDNTKAMEFTLTTSGQSLSFSNSMVGYELKVGGVDVTKKAEINGNVLSFVPNGDNLPSSALNIGNRTVDLKVWSKLDNSITASKSYKLSVVDSTYIIEVREENSQADIYDLPGCKAKIWYRINLDGEYLTAQELQEGLDSGRIKLDYKKFGWVTMLPPTVTTEVVEDDGEAYIVCSLGTTWWEPLASLAGSFVSTGDKEVKLSIAGCSNSGVFSLTPVSITSRIWRWLVIILTIYLIIHIALWIIGFFTVKPLPRGFVVKITLQDNPARNAYVEPYSLNFDLGPKLAWHLKRFIPFREFISQPAIMVDDVNFMIDEDGNEIMTVEDETFEFKITADSSNEAYINLIALKEQCRDYRGRRDAEPLFETDVATKKFRKILEDRGKSAIPAEKPVPVNEDSCYVKKDSKGKKLKEVIVFVRSI